MASVSLTDYASPPENGPFIADRVIRSTSYEVVNDGTQAWDLLAESVRSGGAELNILSQTLNFYDGDAYQGLDYGQLGSYGALVRTETLVITDDILHEAYKSGATVSDPPEEPPWLSESPSWTSEYPQAFRDSVPSRGGYVYQAGESGSPYVSGYFAITARNRYDVQDSGVSSARGLLTGTMDPMGAETILSYEDSQQPYDLLPRTVTDPVGLQTQATYDYRILQARELTEPNGNRTAVDFTPLGLVASVAVMGKEGEDTGDTSEQPGTVYTYVLDAYDESPDDARPPAYVEVLQRVEHRWAIVDAENAARAAASQSPLSSEEIDALFPDDELEQHPERFIRSRKFSDGFGRELQIRTQADDVLFDDASYGDAGLPLDPSTTPGAAVGQQAQSGKDRVVFSGWQVYDNKGKVMEKYEPYFGTGWDYASSEGQSEQKVVMYYDPRGQLIRTVSPDGSEQRVIFGIPEALSDPGTYVPTPWERYTFDANDNAGRTHAT